MSSDSSESDAGILEDAEIPDISFIEDANIIDGGFVEDAALSDVGLLEDAQPSLDIGPADSGFADTGLQQIVANHLMLQLHCTNVPLLAMVLRSPL